MRSERCLWPPDKVFGGEIAFSEAYPRSARFENMQFVSSVRAGTSFRVERFVLRSLRKAVQTAAIFGENYGTVPAQIGGLSDGSRRAIERTIPAVTSFTNDR